MILALISQKGGVGKSTLSVSIAWELQERGARVLVVDADPQGTVRITGEVATEAGLPAPTIIALGKDMYRPEQLPTLAANYDHVIIDTPGRLGDVQRAALMVADIALMPVGQSAADAWGLTETLELARQAQTLRPQLRTALVITRKLPRTALGKNAREVLAGCDFPILTTETTYRVAWQEALAAGKGVSQYNPKDAAAVEAKSLVNELLAFTTATTRLIAHG